MRATFEGVTDADGRLLWRFRDDAGRPVERLTSPASLAILRALVTADEWAAFEAGAKLDEADLIGRRIELP